LVVIVPFPSHFLMSISTTSETRMTLSTLAGTSDVFAWLEFIAPLKPGSVMGLGTIPDCTGPDRDDFIDPGTEIRIILERLGTLRCRFAEPTGRLLPSRWQVRKPLQKYQGLFPSLFDQ